MTTKTKLLLFLWTSLLGQPISTPASAQDAASDGPRSTIEYATYWIGKGDHRSILYAMRASAYYEIDSMKLALDDYTMAIHLDTTRSEYYSRRGAVNYMLSRYDESISDYTKAVELGDTDSSVFLNRAWAYEANKDYLAAESDYSRLIKNVDLAEVALFNRATLYTKYLMRFDAALMDWDSLIKKYPSTRYFFERANCLLYVKNYAAAVEDLNRALSLGQKTAACYATLGYALGMAGKEGEAIKSFAMAQSLDDAEPILYWRRGLYYFHKKDKRKGCVDILKAKEYGLDVGDLANGCR